jgi:hypothetical protein
MSARAKAHCSSESLEFFYGAEFYKTALFKDPAFLIRSLSE